MQPASMEFSAPAGLEPQRGERLRVSQRQPRAAAAWGEGVCVPVCVSVRVCESVYVCVYVSVCV